MLPDDIALLHQIPEAGEYCRLRVRAGLSAKSLEGAAIGLPNTFFGVVLRKAGLLVGMGRVVGDGGLTFQIVDIAVDPAYQGRGFGKEIVGALVRHLEETAPAGAHISLLADGPAKHLYAKFGFRETAPVTVGMDLPIREA